MAYEKSPNVTSVISSHGCTAFWKILPEHNSEGCAGTFTDNSDKQIGLIMDLDSSPKLAYELWNKFYQ